MPERTCRWCGLTFTAFRALDCSPECRRQSRLAQDRARYTTDLQRRKDERKRLRRKAALLAQWEPAPTPSLLPPGPRPDEARRCCQCGTTEPARGWLGPNSRWCRDCRRADQRQRVRERSHHRFTAGVCAECGTPFIADYRPCTRYCTARCARRHIRRQGKQVRSKRIQDGVEREPISLAKVAKRDGWRCHICARKVTRKDWSLDHLIPLSHGGTHTYTNVALAHRQCNSMRGANGPAQLRLVA